MRWRNLGVLLLALVLVMTAGLACAEDSARVKLGTLDIAGVEGIIEQFFPEEYEVVAFPTFNEVLMALKSGRVDEAQAVENCAAFLMMTDDTLEYERVGLPSMPLTMLTREAEEELRQAVNEAIATLKENGTLEALQAQYLDGATPDNVPVPPAAQRFDGAREIIIGVSGDVPPYDYIAPSGEPVGFNVALVQEIAAIAGLNVRFETVMFGSKFAALESGRIDLFFLHAGYTSFEGIVQTEAYDEDVFSGVLRLN